MAQKDWTSGYGLGFDGIIQGLKSDHAEKIKIDRRKIAPTNKHAATPHELVVPKKCLTMQLTKLTENLFKINNRTNNASEATNSSLNRFFPKRVSFNVSMDRIHNWKCEKIRDGYAIEPMEILGLPAKPSVKPCVKKVHCSGKTFLRSYRFH